MTHAFFIVGPTASGKSEIAADVAREVGAEIVSADAFQLYRRFDLLTAKPDVSTLAKAAHHLIGTMPVTEEVNAEKYRRAATLATEEINSRGKLAILVGGSGLYIKAMTHGLAPLAESDPALREKLNAMSLDDLCSQLLELDAETARKTDLNNRRRVVRALEVCLVTGKSASAQREWTCDPGFPRSGGVQSAAKGVFLLRDREELYERINQRVEAMFEGGVIEEVRTAGEIGRTASQMIGLREIRELLAGKKSVPHCIAEIQQATRRYAKRQLTWFRRQTNFPSLNLSTHDPAEAVELISQSASRVFASG